MSVTITLPVDEARNDTLVNHAFLQVRNESDKSIYIGPSSTLATRDDLTFQRTYPKRSGNSQGIAETYFKFAQNVSVPGIDATTSVEHLSSIEVRMRHPVGMSDAAILVQQQRVIALLNMGAVIDPLTQDLIINLGSIA